MCGIFGFIHLNPSSLRRRDLDTLLSTLFSLSETRGKEAAGLALVTEHRMSVYKDSVPASQMLRSPGYKAFLDRATQNIFGSEAPSRTLSFLGHTRLVTNGSQILDRNNQPVQRGNLVMVHNGIIVNEKDLSQKYGIVRHADVDTEAAAAVAEKLINEGMGPSEAVQQMMGDVFGETSIAMLFRDRNALILSTNTGSLFVCKSRDKRQLFFVSERFIAMNAVSGRASIPGFEGADIRQVSPGEVETISLENLERETRRTDDPPTPSPAFAQSLGFYREVEEKAARSDELRKNMRRCARCILPETMPFIAFDDEGICNYCRTYEPIALNGRAALEERLSIFAGENGGPNSIVSFSGGRDSSYGLHLLVKEFGLRPVAYTYDWGMVTDLGRRNQARMCHQLGVEHIWISADIRKKRQNIRRNVLAWLARPRLGTVPLFMAGDKHYFYFANQTMKQTGIENLIMCTNFLERTDFKVGFAGVMPRSLRKAGAAEHIHLIGLDATMRLALFYAKEVVLNPRYLNASVPDTLSGFFAYYVMNQPHLDIFYYLPWIESEVDDVLLNEYNWEIAPDAASTWRIGDGTAPFYNYIYRGAAGFTEFDTFRSNQIREGHITREDGLSLAERDNQPRFESIRDYCSLINVDFEYCMRAVNRMPRLYDPDTIASRGGSS